MDFPGKVPANASETHRKMFPKPSPEGPRDLQNRSGRPPEAPETMWSKNYIRPRPGTHFGAILELRRGPEDAPGRPQEPQKSPKKLKKSNNIDLQG